MFLIQKYTQYKAAQAEQQKRKVTEKELAQLNHKIDKLLTKLDEHEPEIAVNQDEECVVCVTAKATMQTYPCGHRVVCRKCFVKTIQMAVAQRLLPLRCVICRAKILRLKHSTGSVQSLPASASQYTIGHNWYGVPQSASLYSVTSNTSATSGTSASSASSCSSSASYKTCASTFSSASSFRKSNSVSAASSAYSKLGYKPLRTSSPSPSRNNNSPSSRSSSSTFAMAIGGKKCDNRVAPAESQVPLKGKLSLIQEFRREFIMGKEQSAAAGGMHKDHIRDPKLKLHKGSSGSSSSGSSSSCSTTSINNAAGATKKNGPRPGSNSTEALASTTGGNSSGSIPSINNNSSSRSNYGRKDGAKASSSTSLAAAPTATTTTAKSSKENLLSSSARSRSVSGSASVLPSSSSSSAGAPSSSSHTPKKRLSLETPTREKLSGASPIKSSFSFLSGSSLMAHLNLTPKRKSVKKSASSASAKKVTPTATPEVVIPKLAPPPAHPQAGSSSSSGGGFRLSLSRCGRNKLKEAKNESKKGAINLPEEQPLMTMTDLTASSPK